MALQMEDSKWYGQVGRRSVELQEMVRGVQFKDDAKVKCIRFKHRRSYYGFRETETDNDQIIEEPQIILTTAESGKMQVDFADMDYMQKTGLFVISKEQIQTIFEWLQTRN